MLGCEADGQRIEMSSVQKGAFIKAHGRSKTMYEAIGFLVNGKEFLLKYCLGS